MKGKPFLVTRGSMCTAEREQGTGPGVSMEGRMLVWLE